MDDDTTEPFGFPAIGRKKLVAAFIVANALNRMLDLGRPEYVRIA